MATPAPPPTAAIANQSQALLTQPPALGIVSRTGPQTTSELTRETDARLGHRLPCPFAEATTSRSLSERSGDADLKQTRSVLYLEGDAVRNPTNL